MLNLCKYIKKVIVKNFCTFILYLKIFTYICPNKKLNLFFEIMKRALLLDLTDLVQVILLRTNDPESRKPSIQLTLVGELGEARAYLDAITHVPFKDEDARDECFTNKVESLKKFASEIYNESVAPAFNLDKINITDNGTTETNDPNGKG